MGDVAFKRITFGGLLVTLFLFFDSVRAEEPQYGYFLKTVEEKIVYPSSGGSDYITVKNFGSIDYSGQNIQVLPDSTIQTVFAMHFKETHESYQWMPSQTETCKFLNWDEIDTFYMDPNQPVFVNDDNIYMQEFIPECKDTHWQYGHDWQPGNEGALGYQRYYLKFTLELRECQTNCEPPPPEKTCNDVMQDIPEAPIKVDSDIWLNVGLQDRTRCVPVQGLYCQYNIDTSIPAACDGAECHTTAIATGGDECNPAPVGELGDSTAVPPTQSPAEMGGVSEDGSGCTPTTTAMGTFCLGGEAAPENCVTGPNGQVCDGDAPTVELPDGTVVPLPPDSVCGVKNSEFGCVHSDDQGPGCGTFAGEEVCIDSNGQEIDPSSPDHPANGGNGDGDETNDFEEPTDPTDPDAPTCDPAVEECSEGKMIVDAIAEQTQALIDNDTLLQQENQQFLQDTFVSELPDSENQGTASENIASINESTTAIEGAIDGEIDSLSDATNGNGFLSGQTAGMQNRADDVSGLFLLSGACTDWTVPFPNMSYTLKCNDFSMIRNGMEIFFGGMLLIYGFMVMTGSIREVK